MKNFAYIFILVFCFTQLSAGSDDFDHWDVDNDNIIERHEFTTEFVEEFYNNWDPSNKKGLIE